MPPVPVVTPDGTKIQKLLHDRGYVTDDTPGPAVLAAFTQKMRFGSARNLYYICRDNKPCSVAQIFEIARVLKVKPQDISDYDPPARRKAA